jgi:hypothetical protein
MTFRAEGSRVCARCLREETMPAAPGRQFTEETISLEVQRAFAGYVNSAEGGLAVGNVVTEKVGPDHIVHKHLAGATYEDITVTCGTGMSKAFYEWVKSAFDSKHMREDIAVKTADYDGNVKTEMDVFHGLISGIGFPALDASSKNAATLTVKISPEFTRLKKGSGKLPAATKAGKTKKWLSANFSLTIAGLDCTRVSRIEALTLAAADTGNTSGKTRDLGLATTALAVPNLIVTLSEASAQSFFDWHDSFVIKGENGEGQEKTGTLDFLTPDLKESLFTLKFLGLGIFRLTPDKTEAGSGNVRRVKAELYCESISFSYGAGAVGA